MYKRQIYQIAESNRNCFCPNWNALAEDVQQRPGESGVRRWQPSPAAAAQTHCSRSRCVAASTDRSSALRTRTDQLTIHQMHSHDQPCRSPALESDTRSPLLDTDFSSNSKTRSSAIAEGPRDASCQLKSCQLPRNSAETTCTTSPEPSISCRYLTRATKSCCRQRLTICAINYSGRASELGGIIDLVDRRQSSLSRSEHPPFSS